MKHLRGKFIVIDGPEGAGKSTQLKLLLSSLEAAKLDVLAVRDPGSTRIGEQIRAVLLNPDNVDMGMRCEMLLYMAARAQMMRQQIRPALDAGRTVVSDRFVSSTLAYQLGGDGLSADEIRRVADIAIEGRWPDVTLLLDLPVEISFARVKPKYLLPFPSPVQDAVGQSVRDRIEQRPIEYHRKVRENYLAQAKADPKRYRVISAEGSAEAVHDLIMNALKKI
jgi:dTMP kinase